MKATMLILVLGGIAWVAPWRGEAQPRLNATATFTTNAALPRILIQPQSQSVVAGAPVTFSVAASGTPPLSYQWKYNNASIPGATASSYTLQAPESSHAGLYTVTVQNQAGSVSSAPAALTVLPPPVVVTPQILTHPQSEVVAAGGTVTFSVSASGTPPLRYQWLFNGLLIPSATAASYSLIDAQANHAGTYYVVVANEAGSAVSAEARLTVLPPINHPPTISDIPDQSVTEGGNTGAIAFAIGDPDSPLGDGLTVVANSSNLTLVPNASIVLAGTGATRTVTITPAVGQTGSATITVTVFDGAGASASDTFVLTVQAALVAPHIQTQPQSQTVTAGDSVNFHVSASGTEPLLYQWSFNDAPIPGATGPSYSLKSAQPEDSGAYGVLIQNGAGSATSLPAHLEVISLAYDFGDAPLPYPTVGPTAASHRIVPGYFLGPGVEGIDGEPDGQPGPTALGDDLAPPTLDDEDGVEIPRLMAGQEARVAVIASAPGFLDAWVDFDQDQKWDNGTEAIFRRQALAAGVNMLSIIVPTSATPGDTFARFRFSSKGGLSPEGPAPDGEVEDYLMTIVRPPSCVQDTLGTEFWLTFPGNYAPDPANPPRLTVCVVGEPETTGLVAIPGLGWSTSFRILPGTLSSTVVVYGLAELGSLNDRTAAKGVRVTASHPVTVFGMNQVEHTADGFLALPASALGREYIVQSYPNVHRALPELNGTQFAIVGVETNTTVTVIPSAAVGVRRAGIPFNLNLGSGQVYQLRCTSDAPADLSGTVITADKPLAVFGGQRCASINSRGSLFCDYLVEQLLPTEQWGTEFLTVPLATRSRGDTFRLLVAADGTQVTVDSDGSSEARTLNRGETWELLKAHPTRITSDQPISVSQYANSSDFDGVPNSDPFMVTVPSRQMFMSRYLFSTGEGSFAEHYAQVIVPAEHSGNVRLDGRPIAAGTFSLIGSSGLAGRAIPVTPGAHSLTATAPFGLIVYGFSAYGAYAWPGGGRIAETIPPRLTCPPARAVALGSDPANNDPCRALVPDLRGELAASDNCGLPPSLLITQTPPPGTPVSAGEHRVTLTTQDLAGNPATCVTTFTVIDPRPLEIHCPTDLEVTCQTPAGAVVPFTASAKTACGDQLSLTCTPTPGSVFKPGMTRVVCTLATSPDSPLCTFTVTVQCQQQLAVTLTSGTPVLSWSGGTRLERAAQVAGPWTEVVGVKSPYAVLPVGSIAFFRLRP
jgi:hypothetical protein